MELREFAERVLTSPDLAEKLAPPFEALSDEKPGASMLIANPARPSELDISLGRRGPSMPHISSLNDDRRRGLAHHIFCNHELQAVEVMAWVLLAFADAPRAFRRGLSAILIEEQSHTRWHMERAAALGRPFGSSGASGYVWRRSTSARSLLEYIACLPLTFEAANLDHSREFSEAFIKFNDAASAGVMDAIHHDEIRHVRFGWRWLVRLKQPSLGVWDAFEQAQPQPLSPGDARGRRLDAQSRAAVGMPEDFIARIAAAPHDWRDSPKYQEKK